ncbi:hypothetical protein DFS34DRAFT_577966 [Phlyctochytrium arcticum]|nr:hypothetical protein DFS34DRAFT_577966 [Phlyctochytrium arcticum]
MSVVPGRSIGPFSLGATIGDIIHSLREMEHVIPQVECKYGDLNPLDIDIVLNLPLNGMCMRFDPYSQRLKSIEVYDFNKLLLFYSNQEFNSFKVLPTFVHIYKLFGPIYPGEFCKEKKQYVLSYPGISFMFPIPDKYIPLSNVTDLPLSFPDGTTPVLNRLYVFTGADRWQDACPNAPTSPVLSPALMADSSPSAKSPVHATSSPVLAHAHRGVQLPSRSSTSGSVLLLFGTPAQDVLDALGKPDRIMEKEEQRMRIFGGSSSPPHQNGSTANGNFSLGIDILFSEATHSIVKFVLHTNQTGSWDFCVYRKCHFTVLIDTESPTAPTSTRSASGQNGSPSLESAIEISCDQPWADIQPLLQSSAMAAADTRPVVFSRGNGHSHPFGSTWFYGSGVGGCVFEVMRNGYLASVTLFS